MGDETDVRSWIRQRLEEELGKRMAEVIPMYDRCLLCGEHMRWTDEASAAHVCPPNDLGLVGILAGVDLHSAYSELSGTERFLTREALERCYEQARMQTYQRDAVFYRSLPVMHPDHAEFFARNQVTIFHEVRDQ